ncbi:MAG TPA: response regulator [Anaerolineae bacterium]|nr:response regulator [Anaerolineae bacterium]
MVVASPSGVAHEVVRAILKRRGHTVDFTHLDFSTIDTLDRYDLLILEIDMHDAEGVQQCVRVREVTLAPLLVLVPETARNQGIQALDLGADSFVLLPFNRSELVARSEALMRRYRQMRLPVRVS